MPGAGPGLSSNQIKFGSVDPLTRLHVGILPSDGQQQINIDSTLRIDKFLKVRKLLHILSVWHAHLNGL
jgi:hypothetical protein